MKTALALALAFGAIAFAQDRDRLKQSPPSSETNKPPMKKLESVTWDLKTHKLVWVVQSGSEVEGEFVPSSSQKYEITPEDAIMAFADEKRAFTEEEATSLQHLLDVLSLYCAESVVWWDQGQGVPVDNNGAPLDPQNKDPHKSPGSTPKPKRVDKPQQRGVARDLEIASLPPIR